VHVVSRCLVTSGYSFCADIYFILFYLAQSEEASFSTEQTFRFTPYVKNLIGIKIVGPATFTEFGTNNADHYSVSDFNNKFNSRLGHCTILGVTTYE
jgi:hypothetical protein